MNLILCSQVFLLLLVKICKYLNYLIFWRNSLLKQNTSEIFPIYFSFVGKILQITIEKIYSSLPFCRSTGSEYCTCSWSCSCSCYWSCCSSYSCVLSPLLLLFFLLIPKLLLAVCVSVSNYVIPLLCRARLSLVRHAGQTPHTSQSRTLHWTLRCPQESADLARALSCTQQLANP